MDITDYLEKEQVDQVLSAAHEKRRACIALAVDDHIQLV